MNIIRLLKMKNINGELDNLSDAHRYILSIFNDNNINIEYIIVRNKKIKMYKLGEILIYYEDLNEIWGSFNVYIKLAKLLNTLDLDMVENSLLDLFKNKLRIENIKIVDVKY